MRKALIILIYVQIIGCASLKYPDWELVKIEPSVINKPCESKFLYTEYCNDEPCDDWFKKRATTYNANTVVKHKNSHASYFYCASGLPPYQNKTSKPIDKTDSSDKYNLDHDEKYQKKSVKNNNTPEEIDIDAISVQLKKLKALKDEGILKDEEYESRRKILVEKI